MTLSLPNGISRIHITEEQISKRVTELASEIVRDSGEYIHALIILKGGAVFASDLFREIARKSDIHIYHSYLKVSSYGNATESSGSVVLSHDIHEVRGRDILIIEDIIDTGATLSRLAEYLLNERGASSVRTCCLLDKESRRKPECTVLIDYRGFPVDDLFLVGYGLDYAEQYRQLPYIGVLDEDMIS